MRKLIFISMLLFSIGSFAQENLKFTKVIQAESAADKATLYTMLRIFGSTLLS